LKEQVVLERPELNDLKLISCHPKTSKYLLASYQRQFCIWNIESGVPKDVYDSRYGQVIDLSWKLSSNDNSFSTVTSDSKVQIWDTNSKAPVMSLEGYQVQNVKKVCWNLDSNVFATGQEGGAVKLWDVRKLSSE
jgi:WD40 repeat protein